MVLLNNQKMRAIIMQKHLMTPIVLMTIFLLAIDCQVNAKQQKTDSYAQLVQLFKDWRNFETPPLLDGAPDYRNTTFKARHNDFLEMQAGLKAIDTAGWPTEQQVDWMIVWAEMNGYDFNHNILKPWVRDPAFYKSVWTYRSDVPAHEGPTHHGTTEVWTYEFPLSTEERNRFISDLKVITPLNNQAQQNLTGNAKDLWITGIRDIRYQSVVLTELKKKTEKTPGLNYIVMQVFLALTAFRKLRISAWADFL